MRKSDMRFFLCAFEHFLLGIPVDTVSSLIVYPQEVSAVVTRDADGGDWYFSIPHFFGLGERGVRHGIILKPLFQPPPKLPGILSAPQTAPLEEPLSAPAPGRRNILLVPPVEREANIPPEEIRGLPKLLQERGQTAFYTGIRFDESAMMVFINPAPLIVRIIKDYEKDYEGDFHD